MGSFSTGIGIISGFDSASLIEQILLGESRGRLRLQGQIATLQTRQSSMLEVNARLLGLQSAVSLLRSGSSFGAMQVSSSHADVLSATASSGAPAGDWTFIVEALASRHQVLAGGSVSQDAALGLDAFSIEFGGGALVSDMELSVLNGGTGVDRGRIEVTLGTGAGATTHVVDCTGITTVQDVMDRLASVDSQLQASLDDAAIELETTDGRSISVRSLDGATTAEDLGLTGDGSTGVLHGEAIAVLGGETLLQSMNDGSGVLLREGTPDLRIRTHDGRVFDVDIPASSTTLQDVIDAINNAVDSNGIANNGSMHVSIAADGLRLEFTDTTLGPGSFTVASTGGNPHAASDLGIEQSVAGSTISGSRLLAGLDSVLLSNLNGGAGLVSGQQMQVSDRAGTTGAFTLSSSIESFGQLVDDLNQQASQAGVSVRFELNGAGNGLRVVDTTGIEDPAAVLAINGALANSLGIEHDAAVSLVEGANLQHRYVDESTLLSNLNGGQGVGTGAFTIRDATGQVATVDVGASVQSVADLIDLIESKGLAVTARVNDRGDGILLESTASETASTVTLRIEAAGGTTAVDLNLVGESTAVHGAGAFIDGSSEHVLAVDASTTLAQLKELILEAGIPVTASLVHAGDGPDAWRLGLSSDRQGRGGRFMVDGRLGGGSLMGVETVVTGADARIVLGDDPADGIVLQSHTNTLSDVIDGLVIDLHAISASPVTVSVSRDAGAAREAVTAFVESYNQVADLLRSVDSYDVDTGMRGALFGDPTVARISRAMAALAMQRLDSEESIEGFEGLWQIGIRMGSSGQLEVDEESLSNALASNPDAVEALFNREQESQQGFAVRFDDLLESLTTEAGGVLGIADDRFQSQIELAAQSIEQIDMRIEARRVILIERFAAMERALAALQSQNSALLSFQSSML